MANQAFGPRLPRMPASTTCPERGRGGFCGNVVAMVAIDENEDGCREGWVGRTRGFAESEERWRDLISRSKLRGLRGVRILAGGKAAGIAGSIAGAFPSAALRISAAMCWRDCVGKVGVSEAV